MSETEFIKFYKERNGIKNREEAKEKINNFWNALLKAIEEDKKVIFKNWGVFEEKNVKSRKTVDPRNCEKIYTKPKKVLKFRAGKGLINFVNGGDENNK
ncbi:HU family DNA-binding protein [Fusobacterium sp.]|uniref:HU family DNA-binding protein n=1 Tax=Fusobacterium sp. TaxID=68766 RepID=UPI0028FE76E5|nr:HU family DNA-binding protein [Fusobacterium sp.]MDU1910292.1 HU family DNA-binding protein [Fusobacterium sp.]